MKCIYYSDYLKTRKLNGFDILISKTSKSYLIGPKINSGFDENSFYRRLNSSSIYSTKIYCKDFGKKIFKLANLCYEFLVDNEVIEVFGDGRYIKHAIISVPGGQNEK